MAERERERQIDRETERERERQQETETETETADEERETETEADTEAETSVTSNRAKRERERGRERSIERQTDISMTNLGLSGSRACPYRSGEGRTGTCFYRGPPAIWEGFGHKNGFKRASKNLSKNGVQKK